MPITMPSAASTISGVRERAHARRQRFGAGGVAAASVCAVVSPESATEDGCAGRCALRPRIDVL
jgi:hypothetical protein